MARRRKQKYAEVEVIYSNNDCKTGDMCVLCPSTAAYNICLSACNLDDLQRRIEEYNENLVNVRVWKKRPVLIGIALGFKSNRYGDAMWEFKVDHDIVEHRLDLTININTIPE